MEETFTLKMSTEDRFLLDRLSEIEGENRSTVIRNALRKVGREYNIWPTIGATPNPHIGGVWPWADEDVHTNGVGK